MIFIFFKINYFLSIDDDDDDDDVVMICYSFKMKISKMKNDFVVF